MTYAFHRAQVARNLFDDLFKDLEVYSSYLDETFRDQLLHTAKDKTSIIHDPDITMNHAMIVVGQAQDIARTARKPQSNRNEWKRH